MSRFYSHKFGGHCIVTKNGYWQTEPEGPMLPLSVEETAFVAAIDALPFINITAQRALWVLDSIEDTP